MIQPNVRDLLNEQVNKEFYSAYLYLDMYTFFSGKTLNGLANWFYVQAQEERDHATLILTYMLNNGLKVDLLPIAKPGYSLVELIDPFKVTVEHERLVTDSINNIYDAAYAARDFRTMQFLDWFVKEQGEEEKNADDNFNKFLLFGGDPKSLYQLDAELGTRIYAPPTLVL